ncbi:hypothetical protein [Prauserella cavernicola]|uniref:DUF3093 domain-containing protein n=1 Tax=Prauserella cavernicola TaxID=2800127 RepID=A0A934QQF7_9PSEU|nr:hypothetical protein [Prauserella cavernicola]MBK1784188.1 hypothetical protein [Prauserella cavernicola]
MSAELYSERGANGLPLVWGPLFALLGYLSEVLIGDPPHTLMWIGTGVGLFGLTALWVYARRRFLVVRVTPTRLVQGREELAIADIAALSDEDAKPGTRVLGGGLSVPRKYAEIPLRLTDGTTVLAWAGDEEEFRGALSGAMKDCTP